MKVALGAAVLALSIFPARAQFEPLAFAVCKKLQNDTDRLKCFDAIGLRPKTAEEEAKEPTPIKGKWVYTESKSPVDDSDQLIAVMLGEPEDNLLVFRCWENRTEAVFVPSSTFIGTGRASLLIRINSDAPETISASIGTNGRSLFISPAPDFMRLLPDNGKVFFRATGFQGRQSDGTFSLADVSAARDRIAQTCHWSTPKADLAKVPVTSPTLSPAVAVAAAKPRKPKAVPDAGPTQLNGAR
jgi:hypothetical protein